jgi:hypothetical protein
MPGTDDKSGVDVLYYSNKVAVTTVLLVNVTTKELVPANPDRQGFQIYNPATSSAYIRFGNINNGDSVRVGNDTYFEMLGPIVFTGAIYGRRNGSSTGTLIVTEYF